MEGPIDTGGYRQLFIRDDLIESIKGLTRVVNQPRKYHANPVLTYDKPWEGNCVITWGSVLYDSREKLFRIWYEVYRRPKDDKKDIILCYAASKDGIHWEKPSLGLVDYKGSKDNNIVFEPPGGTLDSPTVIEDPRDPDPERRFKLFFHTGGRSPRGIYMACSPDGIHWNLEEDVKVKAGDRNTAYYDDLISKYRVVTRIPGRGIRTCGLWESDDCRRWEFVKEILAPDEDDPPGTQLYGMVAFCYEGIHLGYVEPFFVPERKLNAQLIYSIDGYNWMRACDRKTFLDWGPEGSWDSAWVFPSHNPPIRIGDELFIFYQGRKTLHWSRGPYWVIGSIGLSFLRPDGFVSLDAIYDEGTVTTSPLLLRGDELHVNAEARPGYVTAEILGSEGEVVPGFEKKSCTPMCCTDSLDYVLSFGRSLRQIDEEAVKVRFYLRGAKLYSFWLQ